MGRISLSDTELHSCGGRSPSRAAVERCILDVATCEGAVGSHSARHTIGRLSSDNRRRRFHRAKPHVAYRAAVAYVGAYQG